jgi:hypothetical protein
LRIIGGFKNPATRPRYVIWSAVVILIFAAFMVVALGVTSSYWFCANGCHKVQDDTITAYNLSSHSEISCMACHMPVNANPAIFLLHKMEALGELYMTVSGTYEIPLNGEDNVALEMNPAQCTQCHTPKRKITPTKGILINHEVHAEKSVQCTVCHNRVAHDEGFKHVNVDPATGKTGKPHPTWMTMAACFRCHSQAEGAVAPGQCTACHPKNFELKPASHREAGFFPAGHGDLGKEEAARVQEARKEFGLTDLPDDASGQIEKPGTSKEAATSGGKFKPSELVEKMLPVQTINYCYTCHDKKRFCSGCHGVDMPHPASFKKGEVHGKLGKASPKTCSRCHGKQNQFCNECHHGKAIEYKYDPSVAWRKQHPVAVRTLGAGPCFDCHDPTYCARCHVTGSP